MSDEFTQRLTAAKARAQAVLDQNDAAEAATQRAWEQQVEKVNDAIKTWSGHIVPTIMEAVNEAKRTTGLNLGVVPGAAMVFSGNGRAPSMPNLPSIVIGYSAPRQRTSPVTRGQFPSPAAPTPQVQISITFDGMIIFSSPAKTVHAPLEASIVSKDMLRSVVADFVDVLIP